MSVRPSSSASSPACTSLLAPADGITGQLGGTFQSCGSGHDSPALCEPRRHRLQFSGHIVVGARGRCGRVPGAPVGLVSEDLRERGVRGPPLRAGSGLVDRRPDQRMPEMDACAVNADERGADRRLERVRSQLFPADETRCRQYLRVLTAVVGSRDEQERTGRRGQCLQPSREGAFQAAGEGHNRRQRGACAARPARQGPGQFG